MAQQVKALVKPANPSSTSRTHRAHKTNSQKLSSDVSSGTRVHSHKISLKKKGGLLISIFPHAFISEITTCLYRCCAPQDDNAASTTVKIKCSAHLRDQ